ncbi:chorismate synthase [Desulfovibrio sp. OttesenSCG-928-G15]|nr:chorismate synthase [Desulfovibrio sp. OttesenSCG-928-G15]
MASNSFGTIFRFTSWGESHGPAVGVVIDGCPAGVPLDAEAIDRALVRRAPGNSAHTSARKESDACALLSGVFEGRTTGAPISILINNTDADSSAYEPVAHLLRPGHANFTYLEKYGAFDYRGGGRASARETACRVAAGEVARRLLSQCGEGGIKAFAWLSAAGEYQAPVTDFADAALFARQSPVFAPCAEAEDELARQVALARENGDSVGGVVSFYATGLPAGLGDPVYEKLEARLASAMLSVPASKGFEIGEGFGCAVMRGSACNDAFTLSENGTVITATNRSGGILGGISTGMPLYGRVAFKPTPSIRQEQQTVDIQGAPSRFCLPSNSRHDPCVAVRAVPVVEAMCLVVLADAWLMNQTANIALSGK